ncbi:DUF6942 family protein [Aliiglaciecola litoralis]
MSHPFLSNTPSQPQGLGDPNAQFNVYIGNRPNCDLIHANRAVQPLNSSDIGTIGQACGNGWRKVFNVYAKLLFALGRNHFSFNANFPSWQAYRDNELLQMGSRTALWFSPPENTAKPGIELIMGRTYAKSLQLPVSLTWLNEEFALANERNLIVCPYFDYRQLSNQKILYLVDLLTNLKATN